MLPWRPGALDMSWLCLLLGRAVVSGSYDLGERKEFWHFLGISSFCWQPYQEERFEIISVGPECLRISLCLKSMCSFSSCSSEWVHQQPLPKGQGSGFVPSWPALCTLCTPHRHYLFLSLVYTNFAGSLCPPPCGSELVPLWSLYLLSCPSLSPSLSLTNCSLTCRLL